MEARAKGGTIKGRRITPRASRGSISQSEGLGGVSITPLRGPWGWREEIIKTEKLLLFC